MYLAFKLHDKQYFSPFYLGRLWYVGFGSIINLIFVHKHVCMKKNKLKNTQISMSKTFRLIVCYKYLQIFLDKF